MESKLVVIDRIGEDGIVITKQADSRTRVASAVGVAIGSVEGDGVVRAVASKRDAVGRVGEDCIGTDDVVIRRNKLDGVLPAREIGVDLIACNSVAAAVLQIDAIK